MTEAINEERGNIKFQPESTAVVGQTTLEKYDFKIIDSEQTPMVPAIGMEIEQYLEKYKKELECFHLFAMSQDRAVGLAGNQCSMSGGRFMHRIFSIMNIKTGTWQLIIDPTIDDCLGQKQMKSEGCLTWGSEKKILADRFQAVKVSYYTRIGERVTGELYKGFDAQIWQHEVNHLNGVEENVVMKEDVKLPLVKTIGRNDVCPFCASGKKYKKCCIIYS